MFPDLARDSARPPGPDLAHIDKVFAFALAKVEGGDTAGVFDETNDRKLAFVDGLDRQPVLIAI
ncbi:hypothetical protein CQ12_33425 [Bradyrhizobium jicamae]|uniref:Uncharacterized protein n=1 Tax=Bradyrhizobium jicamae TaxID=280332 RepID=A0A0R3LKX4_9BRAD|nr:hypothetical protein [Bradyrhizobium jicamae]KRR06357.1 hypothetical protein CQ12_33425 [Bradyrhizobium jicamae]